MHVATVAILAFIAPSENVFHNFRLAGKTFRERGEKISPSPSNDRDYNYKMADDRSYRPRVLPQKLYALTVYTRYSHNIIIIISGIIIRHICVQYCIIIRMPGTLSMEATCTAGLFV